MKLLDNNLTIKNYKEPLLPILKKDGFGYYGTLIASKDGQTIQCHICGKLFANLSSHVRQAHKISIPDYREKFQLAYSTALVSENERMRLKECTLAWLNSLTEKQKEAYKRKARKNQKIKSTPQQTIRLETKNKRGTCPDQLLQKIKDVAKELNHTPSLGEFIDVTGTQRYKHLIFKTFGSWKNALGMLKMQPKTNANKGGRRRYGDEELLEYLSLYAQENLKIPTATDCKRGLLPDYYAYIRRFGSFEKARELAGVYNFV